MFKIVQNRTFTHNVTVLTPVDGGHEEESLRVTYNFIETDEAAKYDVATTAGMRDFLTRIVSKLDDLVDDQKRPITYSDAIRDQLLKMPNVVGAVYKGYVDAVAKAKVGN